MVEAFGALVLLLGVVFVVVGHVWFLVEEFRESVLWFIAALFFPVLDLLFLVLAWDRARRPFFLQLLGIGAIIFGAVVLGGSHGHH